MEAYRRFLEFVSLDKDLSAAVFYGQPISDEKLIKGQQFLVKDPFFQKIIISQLQSKKNSEWFQGLPKQAKVRFLVTAASINPDQFLKEEVSNQLVEKIFSDPDIKAALKNESENDAKSKILSLIRIVQGSEAGDFHHLSRVVVHLRF